MFSHGRWQVAHLSSIARLKRIVKNSILFNTETLRSGKVHTFFSLLDIGGTAYRAKIIVREDGQGRKFYDLSESGIRKSRVPSRLLRAQEHGSSPTTPGLSIKTLDDLLSIVNDEFYHYSQDSHSLSGSTVPQARRAVRKFLGKTGYKRWKKNGTLKIVKSFEEVPVRSKATKREFTPDSYLHVLDIDSVKNGFYEAIQKWRRHGGMVGKTVLDYFGKPIYSKDGKRIAGFYELDTMLITLIAETPPYGLLCREQ